MLLDKGVDCSAERGNIKGTFRRMLRHPREGRLIVPTAGSRGETRARSKIYHKQRISLAAVVADAKVLRRRLLALKQQLLYRRARPREGSPS